MRKGKIAAAAAVATMAIVALPGGASARTSIISLNGIPLLDSTTPTGAALAPSVATGLQYVAATLNTPCTGPVVLGSVAACVPTSSGLQIVNVNGVALTTFSGGGPFFSAAGITLSNAGAPVVDIRDTETGP